MQRINVAHLLDEKATGSIAMNIAEGNERCIRFAKALGVDDGVLGRMRAGGAPGGDFAEEIARVFEGDPGGRLDDACSVERSLRSVAIHPVAAHAFAALGVATSDLVILSFWSAESVNLELPGGDAVGLYVRMRDHRTAASLHLGPDLDWESDCCGSSDLELRRPLPDTTLPALAGRPLRDLVSHRALDGLPLVVERADVGAQGGVSIQLRSTGATA